MMSSQPSDPTLPPEVSTQDPNTNINMRRKIPKRAIVTLLILVYINLLNYMDRFTVSSKLEFIFYEPRIKVTFYYTQFILVFHTAQNKTTLEQCETFMVNIY